MERAIHFHGTDVLAHRDPDTIGFDAAAIVEGFSGGSHRATAGRFMVGSASAQVPRASCVSGHGAKDKGDGTVAAALNPKLADWTSQKVRAESDGEVSWKISNGRGAMPPWRHLPEKDPWVLMR